MKTILQQYCHAIQAQGLSTPTIFGFGDTPAAARVMAIGEDTRPHKTDVPKGFGDWHYQENLDGQVCAVDRVKHVLLARLVEIFPEDLDPPAEYEEITVEEFQGRENLVDGFAMRGHGMSAGFEIRTIAMSSTNSEPYFFWSIVGGGGIKSSPHGARFASRWDAVEAAIDAAKAAIELDEDLDKSLQ